MKTREKKITEIMVPTKVCMLYELSETIYFIFWSALSAS